MPWLISIFSFTFILGLWLAFYPQVERVLWQRRLGKRISSFSQGIMPRLLFLLRSGDHWLTPHLPEPQVQRWQALLQAAGLVEVGIGAFFLLRLVLALTLGALAALALPRAPWLWVVSGAGGYYFPVLWLRDHIQARRQEFLRVFPQVVELLALTIEAGANFLGALTQVVGGLKKGPVAEELGYLLQELRLGRSHREGLLALATRLELPEVHSFALTLIQAEQMGTSVAKVMRLLAGQMRARRGQRLETAALLLPIKMLFPLVFLIFPALLIVLLAPLFLNGLGGVP